MEATEGRSTFSRGCMMQDLGTFAATLAMQGAAEWLKANDLVRTTDLDAVCVAIRRHATQAVHEALADAREAFEAGMTNAASATFAATMKLAGIAAAKEIAG
jgi:hypothetical protein